MESFILFCLLTFINTFIIITAIDICLMGFPRLRLSGKCQRPGFLISAQNRIDRQNGLECSAYAAAFLIRHFGMDASGMELYPEITVKRRDGSVYPKGVVRLLAQHGLKAIYCTGNLNALKNEISRGNPVIVFIRVRPGQKWLHYVPVVGYDEENLFLADSLAELADSTGNGYNRKVATKDFLKLWNTAMPKTPLYRNTFFQVTVRDE